ncbi:hypothetical protein F4556_004320 [Kitasatospora gansuensis]|uniref:Uncharacterized protein n=1 Tax=Kitasatospora gansuensis TaxID=258050 RepID=A0A7W7SE51_9ACTN|nr:DUF5691 domain-containing protein [Kitasatospora gansuensis]MBB4948785.1 hypothetical protein [Kitasatospora gansuensis]
MTLTDPWQELHTTALLGTDRRPLPPTPTGPAAEVDRSDPATALLDLAALETVRRRAGARPEPAVQPPAPAAGDPRPEPPSAAVRRLTVLLGGHHTGTANLGELLPQWLAAARRYDYRAPAAAVPALLDAARARSELRPDVVALAGPLGRWLAGQNPDWKYVHRTATEQPAAEPDEQLWLEGLFAERVTLISRLRRTEPTAALELLSGTWSTERAEDRLLFLDALHEGLSLADESFLEAALTDRSKNVRATAAELLSTLPESALAVRMAERAQDAVRLEADGSRLTVSPPVECDAGMQRDGIPLKSPTGRGQRAWWFGEVIAAAPLAHWTAETGLTPEQLLRLPVSDVDPGGPDWTEDLHEAWARAAVRQQHVGWARALLGPAPHRGGSRQVRTADTPAAGAPARLLAVLPESERAAWTAAFIQTHGLGEAFQLLGACATPWTPPLSTAVVAALERAAASGAYPWSHSGVLGMTERALAPETAPAVAALAADATPNSAWADTLARLAETLRFRAVMLAELAG